jgi:hypothetical protein
MATPGEPATGPKVLDGFRPLARRTCRLSGRRIQCARHNQFHSRASSAGPDCGAQFNKKVSDCGQFAGIDHRAIDAQMVAGQLPEPNGESRSDISAQDSDDRRLRDLTQGRHTDAGALRLAPGGRGRSTMNPGRMTRARSQCFVPRWLCLMAVPVLPRPHSGGSFVRASPHPFHVNPSRERWCWHRFRRNVSGLKYSGPACSFPPPDGLIAYCPGAR